MSKLIFGCGYLGSRVARLWLQAGEPVYAVTRSPQRTETLAEMGLRPLVADILDPPSLRRLPTAKTVLFAVGYDRSAGFPIRTVYVEGLANVLDALPPKLERLLYVSSTGVYGQSDGSWVDEQSPCNPTRSGGAACLEAERLVQKHSLSDRSIILRMAGIYGPGRIPRRRDLQSGQPIAAPSEGYLNLIHVDDAARAVVEAERRSPMPAVYCIADGQPVQRREYYEHLARLIQAPPPTFAPPAADSPAWERAGASKRVSNRLFMSRLNFQLLYPSYREGLNAIVGE